MRCPRRRWRGARWRRRPQVRRRIRPRRGGRRRPRRGPGCRGDRDLERGRPLGGSRGRPSRRLGRARCRRPRRRPPRPGSWCRRRRVRRRAGRSAHRRRARRDAPVSGSNRWRLVVSTASLSTSPAAGRLRVPRRATPRPRRRRHLPPGLARAGVERRRVAHRRVHDQLGAERLDEVDGHLDHPIGGGARLDRDVGRTPRAGSRRRPRSPTRSAIPGWAATTSGRAPAAAPPIRSAGGAAVGRLDRGRRTGSWPASR